MDVDPGPTPGQPNLQTSGMLKALQEGCVGKPTTFEAYFESLPDDRKGGMERLRDTIRGSIPPGFEETLNYGMPSWVVPHATYESGYHANPKLPLPFLSIASQKSHVAVYHMGVYASPELLDWLVKTWPEQAPKKLDMGKSCIRFKKIDDIPHALLGELVSKMSVQAWIDLYEVQIKRG